MALLGMWYFSWQKKLIGRYEDDSDYSEFVVPILLVVGWLIAVVVVLVIVGSIGGTMTKMVNPEYFALETILKALKK